MYGIKNEKSLNQLFPFSLSFHITGISVILYLSLWALAVSSKLRVKPLLDSILILSNKSLGNSLNEFVESLIGSKVK